MIKVFFCCSWDDNITNFLNKKYKPLTKNSSGIWKNIMAVDTINNAEWVVIIDDIHPRLKNKLTNFNKNKVICIPREPVRKKPQYLEFNFKYPFLYTNFYHCWSSIMCIKKNYDELSAFTMQNKNKLCSTITSGLDLGVGIYKNRVNFIKKLSKQNNFLDKIDIYGYNWKSYGNCAELIRKSCRSRAQIRFTHRWKLCIYLVM